MAKGMAKVEKRPRTGKTVTAQKWMAVISTGNSEGGIPLFGVYHEATSKTALKAWMRTLTASATFDIHAVTDEDYPVICETVVKRTVGKKAAPSPLPCAEPTGNQPKPEE